MERRTMLFGATAAAALQLIGLPTSANASDQGKLQPPSLKRGGPLIIGEQGGFAVGGTVTSTPGTFDPTNPANPAGQTLHGDHARVFYQLPVQPRRLPLVLWHGFLEAGTCWGATPDGREGFQSLFLRRRYGVYTLDQPRRGAAGKTTTAAPISTSPNEQWFYNQFRLGLWPELYPGVQFSGEPETLNQFFRQMIPDTGPIEGPVLIQRGLGALRQDRTRHPCHPLPRWRIRLGHGDAEQ